MDGEVAGMLSRNGDAIVMVNGMGVKAPGQIAWVL